MNHFIMDFEMVELDKTESKNFVNNSRLVLMLVLVVKDYWTPENKDLRVKEGNPDHIYQNPLDQFSFYIVEMVQL